MFLTYNFRVDTSESQFPQFIIAGQLRRDFIILPDRNTRIDVPGGNAIYAAGGLAVWEPSPPPGIVARVGLDYPQEWLERFAQRGIDVRGVHVLPQPVDLRAFVSFLEMPPLSNEDPVASFAKIGQPFPKSLIGYQHRSSTTDSRSRLNSTSIRQSDLIPDYLKASAAHICPLDYLTHTLLPAVLRQAGFNLVTLDPSPGYMNSTFWDDIPSLITGLTAFLPSEEETRSLFHGRSSDLWEMAEAIAAYGCQIVVIKRGERGQLVFDAASRRRWEIPSYPVQSVDPTGAGDAYCGGFLAGLRKTSDPLQAALFGNISASLALQGHGPFYAMDALPGLAHARLEALRQLAREV
jgi:sugar/nucleoside kinase (ribokinase family)